jgi:hypothetical protein
MASPVGRGRGGLATSSETTGNDFTGCPFTGYVHCRASHTLDPGQGGLATRPDKTRNRSLGCPLTGCVHCRASQSLDPTYKTTSPRIGESTTVVIVEVPSRLSKSSNRQDAKTPRNPRTWISWRLILIKWFFVFLATWRLGGLTSEMVSRCLNATVVANMEI